MDEELNENMEDYLDLKEKMIYEIEMLDITMLLYDFNNLYSDKQELENELQQNNDNAKEHIQKYRQYVEKIYLLENDKDIQKAIYNKLKDIEYDEDSIESRAVAMHSVGAAIWISDVLSKIEEESNLPVEELIADIVEDMRTEDLIQILEWGNYDKIMNLPKVHNIFNKRIDEMTEAQFIIYLANCKSGEYCQTKEFKAKCLEKIKNGDKSFITFYINVFSDDDKMIGELLNMVKREEKVSAIISSKISENHSNEIINKLQNMIKNLSEEEFVRFLCADIEEENPKLIQVVLEKMYNLSDENIRFLLYTYYMNMEPSYKLVILNDLIISRNLIKNIDGVPSLALESEEIKEFTHRYRQYFMSDRYFIDTFPYFSGFEVAKLNGDDSEISNQNMINTFKANEEIIENYNKFINYISFLSKLKDEDLYKIIIKLNKNFNFEEEDKSDLKLYFDFTQLYLANRILNMNNNQLLDKMCILGENDAPFYWTITTRRHEKGLKDLDCINIELNNTNNDENTGNANGTKEKGNSDNSRDDK